MIDTKKLLEGLDIKIVSKDEVLYNGYSVSRVSVQERANEKWDRRLAILGYRVVLALMDECDDGKCVPVKESAQTLRCEKHNCDMILNFYQRGPNDPPGNGWSCLECAKER